MKQFVILRMLRLCRFVRMLRLLKIFKELWLIVKGLIDSLRTILWASLLIVVFTYSFAIFTTQAVGHNVKTYGEHWWKNHTEVSFDNYRFYGTVPRSMLSLLEIVIQAEGAEWRPVVEKQPMLLIFYMFFVAFSTFGVMNVIVAVIVHNLVDSAAKTETEREMSELNDHLKAMHQLCDLVFVCDLDGDGILTHKEIRAALRMPQVASVLSELDFLPPGFTSDDVLSIVDPDAKGSVTAPVFLKNMFEAACDKDREDARRVTIQRSVHSMLGEVRSISDRLRRLDGRQAPERKDVPQQRHEILDSEVFSDWAALDSTGSKTPRFGETSGAPGADAAMPARPNVAFSATLSAPRAAQPGQQQPRGHDPGGAGGATAGGGVTPPPADSGSSGVASSSVSEAHNRAAVNLAGANFAPQSHRLQRVEAKLDRLTPSQGQIIHLLNQVLFSLDGMRRRRRERRCRPGRHLERRCRPRRRTFLGSATRGPQPGCCRNSRPRCPTRAGPRAAG